MDRRAIGSTFLGDRLKNGNFWVKSLAYITVPIVLQDRQRRATLRQELALLPDSVQPGEATKYHHDVRVGEPRHWIHAGQIGCYF